MLKLEKLCVCARAYVCLHHAHVNFAASCSYNIFHLNIYLRRYVIRRAAESLGSFITGDAFLTHTEVRDFYVTVLVQQDIVKLEIAVDDAARVQEE